MHGFKYKCFISNKRFGHRWPFLRKMSCQLHAWSSRALQESFSHFRSGKSNMSKERETEREEATSFMDTVSVQPLAAPSCKRSFFPPCGPSAPPCKDPSGGSTWRPAPRHSWAALWLDCAGTEPAPYSRSRDRCALQTERQTDRRHELQTRAWEGYSRVQL